MSKRFRKSVCVLPLMASLFCASVRAEPELRVQVDQHGDFVLIGNTLAHDCADRGEPPLIPQPIVGAIGECPEIAPTAPDVYFRADDPSASASARADSSLRAADARSTAVLALPDGAKVTHARLYWGAYAESSSPEGRVRFERPDLAVSESLRADRLWTRRETPSDSGRYWYQAAVDVSDFVAAHGAGAYRVGDIESVELASLTGDYLGYVAWYLVVFYEHAPEPQRNLALFEGLDLVEPELPTAVTLTGFVVPSRELGFDAKLGVVAFEGDANIDGDGLRLGNEPLSDAQNPVENFFNGTRSRFGEALSVVGDLPQLSGAARSMSGVDLDVLDITAFMRPGQSLATLTATSTRDTFLLAAFVTSFATLKPNFQRSTNSVSDVNGESLRPGDELLYTITVANSGSDASLRTVLRDVLPSGVSYVPKSIEIVSGVNAGPKTDAMGDDVAEYDVVTRSVVVRLGAGADAELGGSLGIDEQVTVQLRVRVEPSARGLVRNQALISAAGARGALVEETRSDSDPARVGQQSSDLPINVCEAKDDCSAPTSLCDLSLEPGACVECSTSLDCQDPARPDCSTLTHACDCEAGADACRDDSDGDGLSDVAERRIGSDPDDADSDDDGSVDGAELSPELDSDGDGLINMFDADSDNDGLFDGTEQGYTCDNPGTDVQRKRCRPDADQGATTTHPLRRDTDRGGISDGSEDFDLNGRRDPEESNPTRSHAQDDKARDADSDGLSDELEQTLQSDPRDSDSDDDGVLDPFEHNPSEDTDGDGLVNLRDPDSDDDALFDGTELGRACDARGTDVQRGHCVADADMGQTKTRALLTDTDRGGARDGAEDINHNGRVDRDERNPNDPRDDQRGKDCERDPDCGSATSGRVCVDETCRAGCRGEEGNGCPEGQACSARDATVGDCEAEPPRDPADAGTKTSTAAGSATEPDTGTSPRTGTMRSGATMEADAGIGPDGRLYGGGCGCRAAVPERTSHRAAAWLGTTLLLASGIRRSQRRRRVRGR